MNVRTLLFATVATFALSSAHASTINVATGFSGAGPQASAAAYQSVVDAAVGVASPGYGNTSISLYDNISNHALFGGGTTNIAFKSTIDFGVSLSNAGAWEFRFGVDFGGGGAVFLDGNAVAFNNNDMWWNYSYSNASQYFDFTSALGAGNHQLVIYGLEGCCDGGQQAQFLAPNAQSFVTFGSNDGIAPIPEPETYAMLLAGLGLMGAMARRRNTSA